MSSALPDPSPAPEVRIRLEGVHKSFGPKTVLAGLDLEVLEAESLVVIGGSGTGKSVLLKHMIGLLAPDKGLVEVDGVRLDSLNDREIVEFRRRFGMAFQEGALFDSMTVGENISFPLRRAGRRFYSLQRIRDRVRECLDLVRLGDVENRMPSELSGGMRRRVGFARAIALEPAILLFDEPTSGLDPVMTAVIDELILRLKERLGSTTVTITHDLQSAFRIADRIAMLHAGEIIAIGSPEEIRAQTDPRLIQFLEGRAEGPLSDSSSNGEQT